MDKVKRIVEWVELGPHRLLEQLPMGFMFVNREGMIVWANLFCVRIFGYGRPEIVGKPMGMLLAEQQHERHRSYLAEWFKHPHARSMSQSPDIKVANKNGDMMILSIELLPMETPLGVLALACILERTKG